MRLEPLVFSGYAEGNKPAVLFFDPQSSQDTAQIIELLRTALPPLMSPGRTVRVANIDGRVCLVIPPLPDFEPTLRRISELLNIWAEGKRRVLREYMSYGAAMQLVEQF